MKNEEDEAFDELARRQGMWGGGFTAKRKMAADKLWDKPSDGCLNCERAPPQREWVGLTDEEIAQGNKESWVSKQAWQSAVWWASEKLKEKNG